MDLINSKGDFMSKIQVSNNFLNLVQLQEQLDGILFDYIDTSQKWDKAYEEIDYLLIELITYFNTQIQRSNGNLPEGDVYWTLFMDIASRLIYFKSVALMNLVGNNSAEQKVMIKNALHEAANCLPNVQSRNLDFLQEISQTYGQIFGDSQREFEQIYLEKNNSLKDCLASFNQYCRQETKNVLN